MKTNYKTNRPPWALLTALCMCIFMLPCINVRADLGTDPNVEISFKTIFVEESTDPVDGAFRNVTAQAANDVFAVNPRFRRVQDKSQAEGLLTLSITKEGPEFVVESTLVLATTGEVFATERAKAPSDDEFKLRARIAKVYKAALSRIPFYGTVTGREGDQLTLDIGSYQGLGPGDTIQISRVESIKRHPMLKQIVDIRLTPVGNARVEEVEEGLSFARVENEFPGEKILRLHKVAGVQRAALPTGDPLSSRKNNQQKSIDPYLTHIASTDDDAKELAQYGYISLGVRGDWFSHSGTRDGVTVSGGGFSPGFLLKGEAWFTSRIFAELTLGGNFLSFRPDVIPGVTPVSYSTSTRQLGFNVGYRFLFDDSIYGPQLGFKAGYSYYKWQVSTSTSEYLTPRTYTGLNVGILGTLPFGRRPFGAQVDMSILMFPALTESAPVISVDGSSTVARLYFGGYYFLNPRLSFRAGLNFETYSTDFQGIVTGSTSQKSIGILPSVQYYF